MHKRTMYLVITLRTTVQTNQFDDQTYKNKICIEYRYGGNRILTFKTV